MLDAYSQPLLKIVDDIVEDKLKQLVETDNDDGPGLGS